MICIHCEIDVIRIKTARRRADGKYIYVDNTGSPWNGHACPECKNGYQVTDFNPDPLTKRKCRRCPRKLRKSRYFLCLSCRPKDQHQEGSGEYGAYDYGYGCVISKPETRSFKISEMAIVGAQ